MALNLATLRTRSLTAAVFVIVMLTGLLWNQWSFFILFSVIHFGCWVEYQKLVGHIDNGYTTITPFHKYGVMLAGYCIMLYFSGESLGLPGLPAIAWKAGIALLAVALIADLLLKRPLQWKNIGYSTLGLLYISLSWGLLMDLGKSTIILEAGAKDIYRIIPIVLIASIWINDTMAYIVGSLIGKTPFSKISPKKTWEGTAGGAILCVLVVSLTGYYAFPSAGPGLQFWIAISAIAAVAGTAGDLLESKLKRMANVKDSGSIMPGHGGFLDRFDSLLLATPFVWICVLLYAMRGICA